MQIGYKKREENIASESPSVLVGIRRRGRLAVALELLRDDIPERELFRKPLAVLNDEHLHLRMVVEVRQEPERGAGVSEKRAGEKRRTDRLGRDEEVLSDVGLAGGGDEGVVDVALDPLVHSLCETARK